MCVFVLKFVSWSCNVLNADIFHVLESASANVKIFLMKEKAKTKNNIFSKYIKPLHHWQDGTQGQLLCEVQLVWI